jgi:hypothetical protein
MAHLTRIMYIENKGGADSKSPHVADWGKTYPGGLTGPARIGRVKFSKTRRSLEYGGLHFLKANEFKANFVCEETGEWFWISGPKKQGGDALYATNVAAEIDEDVREEYWTEIRKQPARKSESRTL